MSAVPCLGPRENHSAPSVLDHLREPAVPPCRCSCHQHLLFDTPIWPHLAYQYLGHAGPPLYPHDQSGAILEPQHVDPPKSRAIIDADRISEVYTIVRGKSHLGLAFVSDTGKPCDRELVLSRRDGRTVHRASWNHPAISMDRGALGPLPINKTGYIYVSHFPLGPIPIDHNRAGG